MMTDIDPRIAERRRQVRANRFRGSSRRVVWLLVAVGVIASVLWVIQSPLLAIRHVSIDGEQQAPVQAIITEVGVDVGDPLLLADVDAIQAALEANPWILDSRTRRVWPDTIEVTVVERQAAAIMIHRSGDVIVSSDGTILEATSGETGAERVLASDAPGSLGQEITNPLDLAAIRFVDAWDSGPVTVSVLGEELWADLGLYQVRLGGPTEMEAKARSVAAVLADGQPAGSIINVLAPSRPTVSAPADQDSSDPASAEP